MKTNLTQFNKENYHSWIRDQKCVGCGFHGNKNNPIVVAHIELGYGIMGGKVLWFRVLPLHYLCHQDLHQRGSNTFWEMELDSDLLAYLGLRILEHIECFLVETTL